VPNVVGKTLAAAKAAITRAHCKTGTVSYASSKKIKKGLVISQSRRAGQKIAKNSKINLVVSRGKKR
jgi:beta-lactam-binding protein with PASTA domain